MTKEMLMQEIRQLVTVPVSADSSLKEDLLLSSLKMMMLIVRLEELTNTSLPTERMGEVCTVEDLWALLREAQDQG